MPVVVLRVTCHFSKSCDAQSQLCVPSEHDQRRTPCAPSHKINCGAIHAFQALYCTLQSALLQADSELPLFGESTLLHA